MRYVDLTREQKEILAEYDRLERGWIGEWARLLSQGERLRDAWDANVGAIVSSLSAGEVIPNSSGLRGAESLTKEETQIIGAFIPAVLTTHDTQPNRRLWVQVAGVDNTISR